MRGTLVFLALVPSCSASFTPSTCATDGDCGESVCELREATCVNPASATIRVGMSAPISGPSQSLGTEMKLGVTLAFEEQNAAGGVRGRKLTLELRDDLAGPCSRYVFNVRASYASEARATLEYFFKVKVPDARHLLSFDQNDSFGQAGYSGLVAAYKALRGGFPSDADPTTPISRFRYERGDESSVAAPAQAAIDYLVQLLSLDAQPHTVGILMTDTYGPATAFITRLRSWQYAMDAQQTALKKATRLKLHFSNVSFVGPNALAQRLVAAGSVSGPEGPVPFTQDVLVSQVVPNYQEGASDVVVRYHRRLAETGQAPSFTSLEGYVAARVFIAGLLAHKGPFTPEALIESFESMPDLSLGLGASSRFSRADHNYSKSVWGTALAQNGTFRNVYFWSDGTPIQFFE